MRHFYYPNLSKQERSRFKMKLLKNLVVKPFLAVASVASVASAGLYATKVTDEFLHKNPKPTQEFVLNSMDITDNVLTLESKPQSTNEKKHSQQWDIISKSDDYFNSPKEADARLIIVRDDDGDVNIEVQQPFNPWIEPNYTCTDMLVEPIEFVKGAALNTDGNIYDYFEPEQRYEILSHEFLDNAEQVAKAKKVLDLFAPDNGRKRPDVFNLKKR